MANKSLLIALSVVFLIGCKGNNQTENVCVEHSEWRDNNGPDSCSYYSANETCKKLIGKLEIKSRLHKNSLDNGIFQGGMSSRWLEIKKDSIKYYTPNGEIDDRGKCSCSDGKLKIDWEKGDNLPEEATVHFNSKDFVELRYYDFPFTFSTLQYDKLKPKTNPTKIIGIIE